MDKAAQKGDNFGGRFLWRLILLLIIGYAHSLFYAGDILTIYALLGILLIPFYKIKSPWVLGVIALLFLGLGRYIIFSFVGGPQLFGEMTMAPNNPAVLEYYDTLKNGTITDVFATNAYQSHVNKANFQLGVFGRGYLTFAFFLLGLVVGRMQFFRNYLNEKKLIKKDMDMVLGPVPCFRAD